MSTEKARVFDFAAWLAAMPDAYAITVEWPPAAQLGFRHVEVRARPGGVAFVEWVSADHYTGRRIVVTPDELRAVLADIAAGRDPA